MQDLKKYVIFQSTNVQESMQVFIVLPRKCFGEIYSFLYNIDPVKYKI